MGRRANLPGTLRIVCAALASAFIAQAPHARANASEPPAPIAAITATSAVPARAPRVSVGAAADVVAPLESAPRIEEWQRWRGLSFGTYLSPKSDFVTDDGGIDVVFHFHAGQMAERQMKESGVNAVFVSCGYGIGSGAYSDALANPRASGACSTSS